MAQGKPKEKRRIVVLLIIQEEIEQGGAINRSYIDAVGVDGEQPDHATSAAATKWIKANGPALLGKTLVIASMTKPKELKEKQRVATNFDLA